MINDRLKALREVMKREHLGAFVFPSTDPHGSEYVADHWKSREWISGFDGSAGTAVVTMTAAALWTDSRYFIAAGQQLAGTEYQLMREKMPETPSMADWIGQEMAHSDLTEIGIDGMVNTFADVEQLIADMRRHGGITVRTNLDPLERIWTDRPPMPMNPVLLHDVRLAGETCQDKISSIRRALREQHADGMLVCALDDIAWTLNLRGSDVHCNPVFTAYLLISSSRVTLFADPRKLALSVRTYLADCGVDVAGYDEVVRGIKDYFEYNILIDPDEVNYTLAKVAQSHRVVAGKSPIPAMKAIKNTAEKVGFKQAMLRDGIALTRFLHWLKPAVETGGQTELTVANRLEALRKEQEGYQYPSFDTISAYAHHGAIVHYEPTPETDIPLKPEGLLLLDSGAQYLDGTTDVTRTVALGPLTDEQRRVYTLVLKAHIQLEMAHFPEGCSGTQIDALAREPLWRAGLNFFHGTGHGVGSYLCVHEGPHQVRMNHVPAPLFAGMTVTDEPGVYLEGRFGVRIENVLMIAEDCETEFGRFLRMEPLTLCPIDKAPVMAGLLDDEERRWLDNYHEMVYETLAPHLDESDRLWLREATLPL